MNPVRRRIGKQWQFLWPEHGPDLPSSCVTVWRSQWCLCHRQGLHLHWCGWGCSRGDSARSDSVCWGPDRGLCLFSRLYSRLALVCACSLSSPGWQEQTTNLVWSQSSPAFVLWGCSAMWIKVWKLGMIGGFSSKLGAREMVAPWTAGIAALSPLGLF